MSMLSFFCYQKLSLARRGLDWTPVSTVAIWDTLSTSCLIIIVLRMFSRIYTMTRFTFDLFPMVIYTTATALAVYQVGGSSSQAFRYHSLLEVVTTTAAYLCFFSVVMIHVFSTVTKQSLFSAPTFVFIVFSRFSLGI